MNTLFKILAWACVRGEAGAEGNTGGAGGEGRSIATGAGVAGSGGSGATGGDDWKASLPEDMRGLPAIKDYKDVPSLVKSHVNLQQMIGHDKVVLPNDKSTPEQWNEFYNKLGRPAKVEEYKFPPVKFSNGGTIPEEAQKHFAGIFHKAGVTQKQAEIIFSEYGNFEGKSVTDRLAAIKTSNDEALTNLKKEYGDAYGERVTAAQVAVKTFGSQEFSTWLEETGLGNDANFIKFFSNIGMAVLDDHAIGGGELKFNKTPAQAQEEISSLKKDKDFLKKLTNRNDPGFAAAKQLWDDLHAKLTPKGELVQG